jgi:hypothetical protein
MKKIPQLLTRKRKVMKPMNLNNKSKKMTKQTKTNQCNMKVKKCVEIIV